MKKKLLSLLLVFCLAFVPASIVPVFAEGPDGSEENPFVTIEQYKSWLNKYNANSEDSGVDAYVRIEEGKFNSNNLFNPTNVQNWKNPPKLHLTLIDCEFTGNTSGESEDGNPSFMYLPNCKELVIDGCTFNADGADLKYGINWNLCTITDAEVIIKDSTFTGDFQKNALKLNQRGDTDDIATDIPDTVSSIKSATISGCSFSGTKAVIQLGSQGKNTGDAASPSTGNFPITIENNDTDVDVELAYAAAKSDQLNDLTIKLAADGTLKKGVNNNPLEAVISVSAVQGSNNAYYVKPSAKTGETAASLGYFSDASCTDEIDDVPPYTAPPTRPPPTNTERSLGYRLPMITKEQKGFDSDTTQNFTVNGKYQFRITSLNGQVPVMTCGNNAFTVELASQEGNDYFFVIRTAVPGSTGTIYVNGYYLLVAAAA